MLNVKLKKMLLRKQIIKKISELKILKKFNEKTFVLLKRGKRS